MNEKIKANLFHIMKEYGVTDKMLAKAVPCVFQTINEWANGQKNPGQAYRERLEDIFPDEKFVWPKPALPATITRANNGQTKELSDKAIAAGWTLLLTKEDKPSFLDIPFVRTKQNKARGKRVVKDIEVQGPPPLSGTGVPLAKAVVLTTSFPAIHAWPDCTIKEVSFLKTPHRHIFHVTMKFPVNHNDRDIEFLDKKQAVDMHIDELYRYRDLGKRSCEDIAEELLLTFEAVFVSVFEDNENGAEVCDANYYNRPVKYRV